MANDLATMRERLRQQLSDVDDDTWDAGEKDDLLYWALRRLNAKVPRPLDPTVSAQQITLVADTYYYALDSGVRNVEKVLLYDADGDYVTTITAWVVVGDLLNGTAKIHISPQVVDSYATGAVHLYASGNYDLTTNLIPDDYVAAVLSRARAEALGRLVADRARFKQWQVSNQVQNISVNELLQMVNSAEQTASEEEAFIKRWQMPVTARLEL